MRGGMVVKASAFLALLGVILVAGVKYAAVAETQAPTFPDGRDGKTYKTVVIGGKMWMAENLNVETEGSWCYGNKPDSCAKYGRLYTYAAAKSACELLGSGWHLPSRAEWDSLARSVGGTKGYSDESDNHWWYDAGKYLKSETGWNAYSGIENLDTYGFSALPGGYRYPAGYFGDAGYNGYWWTATEYGGSSAYYRNMDCNLDKVYEGYDVKGYGLSVRCRGD